MREFGKITTEQEKNCDNPKKSEKIQENTTKFNRIRKIQDT